MLEESLKGLREVAAESVRFFPAGRSRSSWRKARKLAVSLVLMMLQPRPWRLGYSQLYPVIRCKEEDGDKSDILKVNAVEGVFGDHIENLVDEGGAVL